MPVSTQLSISPEDLAALRNAPEQIAAVAQAAMSAIDAIRSGADGDNPVGALLSGLTSLSDQAGQLPSLDALVAPLRELSEHLPVGRLGDVTAIGAEIEEVLKLFGPLRDAIASGDIERQLGTAIEQALGQSSQLFTPSTEVGKVLGDLQDALDLLRSLLAWQERAPRPDEVVDLISRGLCGLRHDLLAAPAAALDTALAPLATLLPAGADLTVWQAAGTGPLEFWNALPARLTGSIDWPRLEADMLAQSRLLLDAQAARDRLLSASITALGRFQLQGLDRVATAIGALPKLRDFRFAPVVESLRSTLERTADQLEQWSPTEEEARVLIRGLVDQLLKYIEDSPLGQLRALLIDFQQRLLHAIESLPFRALAEQAEQLLRGVAQASDVVDPEMLRRPVHEFFTSIETQLGSFAGGGAGAALAPLWDGVETAVKQIADQVAALRGTLEGLVGQLQAIAENVQPVFETIDRAVTSIGTTLDAFDLAQPASSVIDELHALRDTVQGLDFSQLPGPALSALHAGAQALRAIDVAGAVNPALGEALATIDPSALIARAADGLAAVTDQLNVFDPQQLATELDQPVDALLASLSALGPDQLKQLIDAALAPVDAAIRSLDFVQLFAPITRLYAELTAKVDAVLDPELIFGPLDQLFQPVVDVVDGMQPSRFLAKLSPHAEGLASNIGTPAGPPAVITGAGLKAALPAGPESEDELFGFRLGDLLIPLIDIHRKLSQVFEGLDDSLLGPAAISVQQSLAGRLAQLDPVHVSGRVQAALGNVVLELSPGPVSVRLEPAVQAYHAGAAAIALAARPDLPAADAAAAERVLALLSQLNPLALVPDGAQVEGLSNAALEVDARVDLSPLMAAQSGLTQLTALLPDFVRAEDIGAASIRSALQALDPAPLREQINVIFDRLGHRIVALKDIFFAAIDELGRVVDELLLPLSLGNLVSLADRLHAGLADQLLAFHPRRFKDEVTLIFDTVKRQLGAFDPGILIAELNQLRDQLLEALHGLVAGLLPDAAPFHELVDRVAGLKPSALLSPLVQTLAPVSQLIASLDPHALFQPLIDAIARVRAQVPDVVAEVEAALDEVLDAIPDAASSGSVGASASL